MLKIIKNSFILLFFITMSFSLVMGQEVVPVKEVVKETPKEAPKEATKEVDKNFPLKDGDTWVMVGDSITAQHLHTNYIEAFCYARYQKLNFCFRNSGVGGDTIPSALARFDWDAAPWKPTIISIELGMNDKNGFATDKYIENMGKLNDKVKALTARTVFISASPMNNGDTSENLGGNGKLNDFSNALKIYAATQGSPFADQFHDLLDIWGKNKPRETSLALKGSIESALNLKNLPGTEHLKAYLAEIAKDTQPLISMQGDAVHPGPPGQLMMAASILKNLNATGFVSSAIIDATGKVEEAKGCTIDNAKAEKDILTFSRLDETLPFPIPQGTKSVISLYPTILELSQYTLKITGLKSEKYTVKMNTVLVATLTAKELETGVNLTDLDKGPIFTQGSAILNAVNAKEGVVGQWRNASRSASAANANEEAKSKVEPLRKAVEEADAKIRLAAKPIKLDFEIAPAK